MQKIRWSSKFSFIMATTGAAVGLGNIWKFPYMAGDNGGSAFVLIYLLCVALIGLPILAGEILLGKLGRSNPISSLEILSQKYKFSSKWAWLGAWGLLGLVLVLSFYSVVAGWSLGYLLRGIQGVFQQKTALEIEKIWLEFLSNPYEMLVWHTCFILMTLWVVSSGVRQGIEKVSNLVMPVLLLILIGLVAYACVQGNFKAGYEFLFSFKLEKITAQVCIEALGHAFFTLATGAGCMLVYGAYLSSKTPVIGNIALVAVLDVLVALLAGMGIFPILFQYNLQPEAGPGLMFKILPIAFSAMPGGHLIGVLFFLILWFAAWTSTISMAEPLVLTCVEKLKWSRKKSAYAIGLACWTLGLISVLSFNIWQDFKILGRSLFELQADFATNVVLPLGGLGFMFVLWNIPRSIIKETLVLKNQSLFQISYFLMKYLAPFAILLIFVAQ